MAYKLECSDKALESLLFWIQKFTKYKMGTMSNSKVANNECIAGCIKKINSSNLSRPALASIIKEARNAGMPAVNSVTYPIFSLYDHLKSIELESLRTLNEEIIIDFLISSTSSLSDATKKNWKASIISFFHFIEENNEEEDGRVHLFRIRLKNWAGLKGRSGEKLPSHMDIDEINRFLLELERFEFSSEKIKHRNLLIIKIILYSGVRVSEALGLKTKDIHLEGNEYSLTVKGKGNKPRIVLIKKDLIKKDFNLWMEEKSVTADFIFHTRDSSLNKPLTQAYVSRTVEKVLMSAGIRKSKNGAHMLRHSYATLLYLKTKDLVLLQETLGHADISTSRKYTHFDKDKLRAATGIFS